MTEEQRQYFELMDSLFAHPGWKMIHSDVLEMQKAITDGWTSYTPDTIRFEQGRYAGLNQITQLEAMIDTAKAEAAIAALEVE